MCKEFSQRKLVVIKQDLDDATQFTHAFNNLGFEPDAVIVRSVSLSIKETDQDYDGQAVVFIWSDLVHDIIASTTLNCTSQPNLYYKLSNNVFGPYTFQVKDIDNVLVGTFLGMLSIHLEFVKY
jgi:hypothetical protein